MLGDRFDDVLERAQGGDALAFAHLWRDTQPMLLRSLWVLDGERCQAISADTWSRVIMALDGFSGDEAGFRRLLASVAHQQHLSLLARLAETSPGPGAGEGEPATAAAHLLAEEGQTGNALGLLARLPAEQAEPVVLHVAMGLDVADIAEVTGRTPGVVRGAVHWALRRLEYMIAADQEAQSLAGRALVRHDDPSAALDIPAFSDDFGVADMFLAGRTDVLSSEVEAVLAAAAAPASAPELAGATEAVALFLALGPGASPAADPFATGSRVPHRVKHRLLSAAFASGLFVAGLSAGAHARVLPEALQNVADSVLQAVPTSSEAPATKDVTAAGAARAPRATSPKPAPSHDTTVAAPAVGLCNAYAKGGLAPTSKARTELVEAAGGESRIPAYCGPLLHPKSSSTAVARAGSTAGPQRKIDPRADTAPANHGAVATSAAPHTPGASRPSPPPKQK